MQLVQLEVKNWCQHKHRVCNFTRGLVGIIGRIGSGKSNLLGAICWALTGENPNTGVKAENVSQLNDAEDSAYVRLEFEHTGHNLVITRYLLPEKEPSTLMLNGVEAARGDKAVTAYVEKLLGIDCKFIARFVLVAQNELFAFIEDGAQEVDRFFQKLFGTAIADKCQDTIAKHLNKLIIPEVIEPSSQIAAELQILDEDIAIIGDEISKLPSLDSFLAIQHTQQKLVNDWEYRLKHVAGLAVLERRCIIQQSDLTSAIDEQQQQELNLRTLRSLSACSDPEMYTSAKIAIGHWATYRSVSSALKQVTDKLSNLADSRSKLVEPANINIEEIAKLDRESWDIKAELKARTNFLATFSPDKKLVVCPTCNTPTSNLAANVDLAKREVTELTAKLSICVGTLNAYVGLSNSHAAWVVERTAIDTEAAQLTSSLSALSSTTQPTLSEAASAKIVTDYENFNAAAAGIAPLLAESQKKIAELAGVVIATEAQRSELVALIASISVTAAVANTAQEALVELKAGYIKRKNYEQQHSERVFARNALYAKYTAAQTAEVIAERYRAWASIADKAKEALKSAPRLVAARNLQKLEAAINELLQVFGVDFFIKAANDGSLSFTAEFFDGRRQPARRLSYGQKTVLALAFRVAVNALFAEEIGLLALDEPTAYLDQQRIKALSPVLEKLRELSTARGLQCLLVTHETSLIHLFESTVELDV